jgi:hypothetical protein
MPEDRSKVSAARIPAEISLGAQTGTADMLQDGACSYRTNRRLCSNVTFEARRAVAARPWTRAERRVVSRGFWGYFFIAIRAGSHLTALHAAVGHAAAAQARIGYLRRADFLVRGAGFRGVCHRLAHAADKGAGGIVRQHLQRRRLRAVPVAAPLSGRTADILRRCFGRRAARTRRMAVARAARRAGSRRPLAGGRRVCSVRRHSPHRRTFDRRAAR